MLSTKNENCPNCGAPVNGTYCKYCGTPFVEVDDIPNLMLGKRVHVFFEDGDHVHCCDIYVRQVEQCYDYTTLYADGLPCRSFMNGHEMTITATLLDPDTDILMDVIERLGLNR